MDAATRLTDPSPLEPLSDHRRVRPGSSPLLHDRYSVPSGGASAHPGTLQTGFCSAGTYENPSPERVSLRPYGLVRALLATLRATDGLGL